MEGFPNQLCPYSMKRYGSLLKAISGVLVVLATSQLATAQLVVNNSDIDTVNNTYDFSLTGIQIQPSGTFSTSNLGGALVSQQNFAGGPEAPAYFWFAWNNSDPLINHAEIVMGWDFSNSSYGITSVDIFNYFVFINPGMVASLSYSTDNFNYVTFSANADGANNYTISGLGGAQTFYMKASVDGTDFSFPNNQWGRAASASDVSYSASFDLQAVPEPSTALLLVVAIGGGWLLVRSRKSLTA